MKATLAALMMVCLAAAPAAPPRDYDAHAAALRAKLGPGFTVLVEPPFVVIGDGPAGQVQRHAEHTVRWATRLLRAQFFPLDPPDIIDIYLFHDAASYRKHARELFGDEPTTPFGYYSARRRLMVMNIATGGGTLVHELVHAFMAGNFPQCPAWLNEGLGSLYEQCRERDGRLEGLPNWRLPSLQQALRTGRVPTLHELCHTTSDQFYGENSGLHYALARYLLLYLQHRGKLVDYFRAAQANAAADPACWDALLATLGLTPADLPAFEQRWHAWVLSLKFPE